MKKRLLIAFVIVVILAATASVGWAGDGVTISGTFTGDTHTRFTGILCDPNVSPVTFTGWVEVTGVQPNSAVWFGLVDKAWIETGDSGWGSGAYAYFGRIGENVRIGPSDGFYGGELNQVGANVPYVDGGPNHFDFTMVIYDGEITVTYDGVDYVDTYGEIEDANSYDAYPWSEFDFGAHVGIEGWPAENSVDYEITISGCVSDDSGPVTTDVVATPNPVAVNSGLLVTAKADDTNTGGSNIASAEYSLDGETWDPMLASDSSFDSPTENVNVTFSAPGAGVYDLCVRGTDAADKIGPAECILLVVYDPEGGFVTGGGWIDSPPGAYMPGPSGIVVVTEEDVDVNWSTNDTRNNGYVAFVEGPGTPPLGVGSLEMGTTASQDKAQLFNYDHIGTLLADIDALSYATYRHSSSTNPPVQYPAINIEVDYVGDGSSYTTLVWEPIYAYGQSNLAVDMWQTWDTMAPSQTSFGGGWWSTKDIPGVCAFNCFVDWGTILQNNPNARIKYGFGVNVGSGWGGNFAGAVDALTLSISGGTVTYDFEPVAPFDPIGKATFGFVAKYKKGAQTPEGQTEFVFKVADLNFHSTSYDWLVVAGAKAKFKGIGTLNGEGAYKFMLTGIDADINENDSFDVDRFRIKIWDEVNDTEHVVYDNGLGAGEDDDNATSEIGGGQIVVHKK